MAKEQDFIGVANFEALWNDGLWWTVLGNTISFTILTVAISVTLALLTAVAIKRDFYGRDFFRVLFYAPGIMSVSVLGLIALRMWDQQRGVINYFIVGTLNMPRVNWLGNVESGHPGPLGDNCVVGLWLSHVDLFGRPAKYSRTALRSRQN